MSKEDTLRQGQGDTEEGTISHCGVVREGLLEVVTSKLPLPDMLLPLMSSNLQAQREGKVGASSGRWGGGGVFRRNRPGGGGAGQMSGLTQEHRARGMCRGCKGEAGLSRPDLDELHALG